MERCQKAGCVSPITSKITLTKIKGEKDRARRRKGGEEKLKNAMIAFLVFIMATMEITVFGRKKLLDGKVHLGITFSKIRLDICKYVNLYLYTENHQLSLK